MANFVSTAFESEYTFYETMHGAAYYELIDHTLVRNPHYPDIPHVQEIKNSASPLPALGTAGSLYDILGNSRVPDMLNYPEKYIADFSQTIDT